MRALILLIFLIASVQALDLEVKSFTVAYPVVKGYESEVNITVKNYDLLNATTATLYFNASKGSQIESFSKQINLNGGEEVSFILYWVPRDFGYYSLSAKVVSDLDLDPNNNKKELVVFSEPEPSPLLISAFLVLITCGIVLLALSFYLFTKTENSNVLGIIYAFMSALLLLTAFSVIANYATLERALKPILAFVQIVWFCAIAITINLFKLIYFYVRKLTEAVEVR